MHGGESTGGGDASWFVYMYDGLLYHLRRRGQLELWLMMVKMATMKCSMKDGDNKA